VKPGNIVGAIANEAGIDSKYIGRIQIFDNYSLVDLPAGMPKEVLQHLKKVWVAGQELRLSLQRPKSGDAGRDLQDAESEPLHTRVSRSSDGTPFTRNKLHASKRPAPQAAGKHRGTNPRFDKGSTKKRARP